MIHDHFLVGLKEDVTEFLKKRGYMTSESRYFFFSILFSLGLLLLANLSLCAESVKPFDYYLAGNTQDSSAIPRSGMALMGGGKDQDEAFKWFIKQASFGDILILRASGDGAYNPYISSLGAVNSVQTIVFNSATASIDPFVIEKIRHAEGVFFPAGINGPTIRSGTIPRFSRKSTQQ